VQISSDIFNQAGGRKAETVGEVAFFKTKLTGRQFHLITLQSINTFSLFLV
jgi:hypothetical protein